MATALQGLYDELFKARYPLPWQMSEIERIALITILEHLKPPIAIEIGTAQGGSLQALATHAQKVYSLEVDPTVSERLSQFANVEFRIGLEPVRQIGDAFVVASQPAPVGLGIAALNANPTAASGCSSRRSSSARARI